MVSRAYKLAYNIKLDLLKEFSAAVATNQELRGIRITKAGVVPIGYNPAWDKHPGDTEGERALASVVHNFAAIEATMTRIGVKPALWGGLAMAIEIAPASGVVRVKVVVPDILKMESLMRGDKCTRGGRPRRGSAMRADSKIARMATALANTDSEGNVSRKRKR